MVWKFIHLDNFKVFLENVNVFKMEQKENLFKMEQNENSEHFKLEQNGKDARKKGMETFVKDNM